MITDNNELSLRQQILINLSPMMKKARQKKLLLRSKYDHDIIFTPDELEKNITAGRFVWGMPNWELVNPNEIFNELQNKIDSAKKEYEKFWKEMANYL